MTGCEKMSSGETGKAQRRTHVDLVAHPVVYDLVEPDYVGMAALFHDGDLLADFSLCCVEPVCEGRVWGSRDATLAKLLELLCPGVVAPDRLHGDGNAVLWAGCWKPGVSPVAEIDLAVLAAADLCIANVVVEHGPAHVEVGIEGVSGEDAEGVKAGGHGDAQGWQPFSRSWRDPYRAGPRTAQISD